MNPIRVFLNRSSACRNVIVEAAELCLVDTQPDTKIKKNVRKYYTLTDIDNGIKSQTLILNRIFGNGM